MMTLLEIALLKDVLERARRDRNSLKQKLKVVEDTIKYLENLIDNLSAGEQLLFDEGFVVSPNRFARMNIADAARAILKERGEPMTVKQISKVLLEGGYKGYREPRNVRDVYTTLFPVMAYQRTDIFKKIEGEKATFGLVEWKKEKEKP